MVWWQLMGSDHDDDLTTCEKPNYCSGGVPMGDKGCSFCSFFLNYFFNNFFLKLYI